jgi:probable rRNA maturation factor
MDINFQLVTASGNPPSENDFGIWVTAALNHIAEDFDSASLCIRIVDEEEITELNRNYRNKDGSTNVLSFPQQIPDYISEFTKEKSLGDILLCAPVVEREATEQKKESTAHWAHLTVHGVLHLLNYDHETSDEASHMESLEIAILHQLGFANPY